MATTPPALGYGQRNDVAIDQFNQWLRARPEYQTLIRSFGQSPDNVHLTDGQKQQVVRLAQSLGAVVDEGHNGQEVDDAGNFQAKSHTLRNIAIVGGIAAATLLTAGAAGAFSGAAAAGSAGAAGSVEAGATAGLGAAALPGAGTSLAAGAAGATAAGGSSAALAAASAAAGAKGLSYGDLLKYGLPVAGNLIGGVIQANAAGNASDAQQKYLEEALAYQKEQDTYTRTRQATLDAQDVQRYGDFQGRIAPFIANGTSSNDRMAALLGLPARSGAASGGSSGPPASQRVATDPATQAAIRAELQRVDSSDDPTAWDDYLASHGDSATKNWSYWQGRIDTGDGVGKGYAGGSAPPAPAAAPASPAAPATPAVTTPPPARAADVQMRAPDGSVKTVPADQVDHYRSLGATLIGAAA